MDRLQSDVVDSLTGSLEAPARDGTPLLWLYPAESEVAAAVVGPKPAGFNHCTFMMLSDSVLVVSPSNDVEAHPIVPLAAAWKSTVSLAATWMSARPELKEP